MVSVCNENKTIITNLQKLIQFSGKIQSPLTVYIVPLLVFTEKRSFRSESKFSHTISDIKFQFWI